MLAYESTTTKIEPNLRKKPVERLKLSKNVINKVALLIQFL